jgi:hypothetical protein
MRFARAYVLQILFVIAAAASACGGASTTDFGSGNSNKSRGGDAGAGGDAGRATGGTGGSAARAGTSGAGGSAAKGSAGGTGGGGTSGGSGRGGSAGISNGGVSGTTGGAAGSGTGGTARGGSSGTSGNAGASGRGTGGAAGSGGSGLGGSGGTCSGECPTYACEPVVALTVEVDSSGGAGVIQNLKAEGVGVHVTCTAFGGTPCMWMCRSQEYELPGGDYSVTLSAPGYASKTIDFTITPPTNCGCCGCGCTVGAQETVKLTPDSTLQSGGCCADLESDSSNCGACGRTCPANMCFNGSCAPSFGACLFGGTYVQTNTTFTSCDDYCASVGQVCSASCGTNSDEASEEWLNPSQNCYDLTAKPILRGCADSFETTVNGDVPEYDCCCGDASK